MEKSVGVGTLLFKHVFQAGILNLTTLHQLSPGDELGDWQQSGGAAALTSFLPLLLHTAPTKNLKKHCTYYHTNKT